MARPFTFHMQIKEDILSQNRAEELRSFFSRTEVIKALDKSETIHFARIVLIPNDRVTSGTRGTFAVQVVLVHDDTQEEQIAWICDTKAMREVFVALSEIGKVACPNVADADALFDYIAQNNLNRTAREMHKGHPLSVKQIRNMFPKTSELMHQIVSIPQSLVNHSIFRR